MTIGVPLHPQGVFGLLGASFRTLVRNTGVLGPLALLFLGPGFLFNLVYVTEESNAALVLANLLSFMGGLFFAAVAALTVSLETAGMQAGVTQILARIRGQVFVWLLGTTLLTTLAFVVGLVLLLIPGIYLAVRFAFTSPIVVLERTAYMKALRRSGELVKGYWWRTFGAMLLMGIACGAVALLLTSAGILAITPFVAAEDVELAGGIIGAVVSLVVTPVFAMYPVFLYYDLRVRKEGGVETLRQAL